MENGDAPADFAGMSETHIAAQDTAVEQAEQACGAVEISSLRLLHDVAHMLRQGLPLLKGEQRPIEPRGVVDVSGTARSVDFKDMNGRLIGGAQNEGCIGHGMMG